MIPSKNHITIFFLCTSILAYVDGQCLTRSQHIGRDGANDAMIPAQAISCRDIAHTATELIPRYHRDNQTDSLQQLLRYWETQCGMTEPLMRFIVLWQIETNTFSEDWLPERVIDYLFDHREAIESNQYADLFFDFHDWEYHPLHPSYNDFTRRLALRLRQYNDLSMAESFFVKFYAHDFEKAVSILSEDKLSGTRIDYLYDAHRKRIRALPARHVTFCFGLWSPTGNLGLLGMQPQVSILAEHIQNRLMYGLNMKITLGSTSEPYEFVAAGVSYESNHFIRVHAGLHAGVDLLNSLRHALFITSGIGYDGIEPLSMASVNNDTSSIIHSVNFNTGLTYQLTFQSNHILSLMTRFNFVNYRNQGGTDLSGNIFTVGLGYGIRTYR